MAEKIRLEDRECPLSATLGLVGEWWTLLILHDAFDGYTRFDQFQDNLGISSSLLTSRLKASGRRRLARTSLRDASPFGLAMPHGGLTRRSPVRHITFRRSARLFALGRGQRDVRTDHPHFRRGW
jgi:hypothetical protein